MNKDAAQRIFICDECGEITVDIMNRNDCEQKREMKNVMEKICKLYGDYCKKSGYNCLNEIIGIESVCGKETAMEVKLYDEWQNLKSNHETFVSKEMYIYIGLKLHGDEYESISPYYIFSSTAPLYVWNLYLALKLDKTLENDLLQRSLGIK